MSKIGIKIYCLYGLLVSAACIYIGSFIQIFPDQKYWIFYWVLAFALSLYIPKKPVIFLIIFILLAYGTPRYGIQKQILFQLGVLNLICITGFFGLIVWAINHKTEVCLPVSKISWLLISFLAWVLISSIANYGFNQELDKTRSVLNHDRIQYIYIFIYFFVASRFLNTESEWFLVISAVCVSILIRWSFLYFYETLYLNSDIGMFSAVIFPFCLFIAFHHQKTLMRCLFGALAWFLPVIILQTQNRTAGVTFFVVLACLFFSASHKLKYKALIIPVIAIILYFTPIGYLDRYKVIWNKTLRHATAELDISTISERMELWKKGGEIFMENPFFGIGPGNYSYYIKQVEGLRFLVAHNSIINIAAETGAPGLGLYLMLCITVIFILLECIINRNKEQGSVLCKYIFSAVMGYFAIGFFSSRQDDVFMYLLFGWVVSLTAQKSLALKNSRLGTQPR